MHDYDKWRMIYGYAALAITAGLAAIIALGKVEGTTSHGLDIILGGLIGSQGAFSNWAFGDKGKREGKDVDVSASDGEDAQ